MQVTFYGGVREVTGSMHVLTNETDRILLDCGMFQGRRKESEAKNRTFPFDPGIITNVVLSHAHIDHSGRIPLLTRQNFTGRIVCTRATAAACEYLLLDAGHIQESDAKYLNYKSLRALLYQMSLSPRTKKLSKTKEKRIKQLLKKNRHELDVETIHALMDKYRLERVRPIYTIADAEKALTYFDGYPYRHEVVIGKELSCSFYDAGHILGSAITMIKIRKNGRVYTVCYTGDLGRFNKPILKDPTLKWTLIS
jgi:metallo-beta-lactamase family protein